MQPGLQDKELGGHVNPLSSLPCPNLCEILSKSSANPQNSIRLEEYAKAVLKPFYFI